MVWQYDIPGVARSKKNSNRIVNVKGRTMVLPSAAYKAYERQCGQYLTSKPKKPIDFPCEVTCIYFIPRNKDGSIPKKKLDLCNLLAASHDILVKYKILEDDNSSIVFSVDGSRVYYTTGEPHTLILIRSIDEDTESESGGHSDGKDSAG